MNAHKEIPRKFPGELSYLLWDYLLRENRHRLHAMGNDLSIIFDFLKNPSSDILDFRVELFMILTSVATIAPRTMMETVWLP